MPRLRRLRKLRGTVSVLFSEPKIPQFQPKSSPSVLDKRFSALQRAENSSIELDFRRNAVDG